MDTNLSICTTIILLIPFLPCTFSLSFNFTRFEPNNSNITVANDSFISSDGLIQLTKNQQDTSLTDSVGRAFYSLPVQLWNKNTNKVADFTTHFSFIIKKGNSSYSGDGLTFYLAPVNSSVPVNSTGRNLGLTNPRYFNDTSKNQFVAVEFDTYKNFFDPDDNHVGIDVNSIVSVANVTWETSIKNGSKANAWVTYESSTKNLSVFLTYADNAVFGGDSSLSYVIDLRNEKSMCPR